MLTTMSNGVRVLTVPNENTQTVSVSVFVNVGSANETPAQNGISHFLEHMAFKGTKRRSYNKISSDAERLGAEMNAFTDRDMTAYFIKGLSEHAPIFIDILGDIFCNSVFDEAEIEKEREVILQEYRMYADKPSYVANDVSHDLAYPGQAFGRKIIGEPKNIRAFSRQDFVDYINTHYRGSNVIVGVAGKFNEQEVLAAIEKAFAKVKPEPCGIVVYGAMEGEDALPTREVPVFSSGVAVKKKSVEQCAVSITYEAVSSKDPLYYAYEVATAAIGDGMSSPLFDEVREKRGLVYSVGAHADLRESSGAFVVTAGTTADKLDEFFTTVTQVLSDASAKVKPIDMERAKNMICVQLATATEKPFNTLMYHVQHLFMHGVLGDIEAELAKTKAVTPAQVKKVLAKILSAKKVLVVVGNKIDLAVLEKHSGQETMLRGTNPDGFVVYGSSAKPKHATMQQIHDAVAAVKK